MPAVRLSNAPVQGVKVIPPFMLYSCEAVVSILPLPPMVLGCVTASPVGFVPSVTVMLFTGDALIVLPLPTSFTLIPLAAVTPVIGILEPVTSFHTLPPSTLYFMVGV